MRLSPARRRKVTTTMIFMRNAPSKSYTTVLGSHPPPPLGNSQSSSQGQRKARDVVCVDFSSLGQGFLEEEFPGEPELMDREMLPQETCCCQPGASFVLSPPPVEALATGGDQPHHALPCYCPFSTYHSATDELPRTPAVHGAYWRVPRPSKREKGNALRCRQLMNTHDPFCWADEHQLKLGEECSIMMEVSLAPGLMWYIKAQQVTQHLGS